MIFLLLGSVIVLVTLREVFQAVLVPRGKAHTFRLLPLLLQKFFWPVFLFVASTVPSRIWRADLLGLFGPLGFVVLLLIWVSFLILGLGLILLAFPSEMTPPITSLSTALYVAGSSVLTLGCADYSGKTTIVRFLILAAAFTGLIITASVISLLFTLIGSLQRREVLVSILSKIAGSPPSGISILETYGEHGTGDALHDFYRDWYLWCADVLGSHRAYPALAYFRSTDADTSWLTALGAVLDSAALLLSTNSGQPYLSAKLTLESGKGLVDELATAWALKTSEAPDISDEEFDRAYQRLKKAGYSTAIDHEAKETFRRLRSQYTDTHRALCKYLAVPSTPFLSDYRLPIIASPQEQETQ